MSWATHSKVYLDTKEPIDAVVAWVSGCAGGEGHQSGAEGHVLGVYVDENDAQDPDRTADPDDGFLFYPYLVDVDAMPGVTPDAYRAALDELLRALARPGVRFVTAAQDEDALWHRGRWDGSKSSGVVEG